MRSTEAQSQPYAEPPRERRHILFVNHEPYVQHGLERMLRPMRRVWEMDFAGDARSALERLGEVPFDVVVSDLRMPGMDGQQFLTEVMRRHPQVVRIILTACSEREATLDAMTVSHQLLTKPCDADTLKATIGRALALRGLLDGETPLKALVSRLESLPSLPMLYSQIVEALQSPNVSVRAIAEIIARDPAMTAKILQLVNSAYFGLGRHVADLGRAVTLLGLETIKSLVLTAQVFSQFDPDSLESLSLETLWSHSACTGALARKIVESEEGDESQRGEALTAGLLHDVGQLLLAVNLPNVHTKAVKLAHQEDLQLWQAERQLFGASHGEVGAYLLGLWGLPEGIVEAVAYHHHPDQAPGFGSKVLTAVHAANALAHDPSGASLDWLYLETLGLTGRVEIWRRLALGIRQAEAAQEEVQA